ncbi:MAG TPA: hypothetical protein EYQ63_21955 [Fuerstia sp.]|nr:hypothetical protein [Fuerstiella sp.]
MNFPTMTQAVTAQIKPGSDHGRDSIRVQQFPVDMKFAVRVEQIDQQVTSTPATAKNDKVGFLSRKQMNHGH